MTADLLTGKHPSSHYGVYEHYSILGCDAA